ncbi:MAG: GAF domain-containing protein [Anaerolineaceae bacterium]|nr:GAF domain-containing protein [Anaerolineaceae bacterium]
MNILYSNHQISPLPVYKEGCLHAVFQAVQAGRCARVLGPRCRSKSALMLGAAQLLQEHGTHNVQYISINNLPHVREASFMVKLSTDLLLLSEVDVYAALFGWLQRELFPMDTPTDLELMQTAREFREGMMMLVRRLDRPLVLFVDNLNAAPPNVVLSLLNTLADLYTAVSHHSGPQFLAVIGGALDLEENGRVAPTRFLPISDLVWIDDLEAEEQLAYTLAACQRAEVTASPLAVKTLLRQTGGDLVLLEHILGLCLKQMRRRGQTELTPPRVADAIDTFLNNPLNPKIEEILRQVESDTHLLHCTLTMLEQGSIHVSQAPLTVDVFPNLLDLSGIFAREGDRYHLKNEIWGQLLQKHLNPARVGGFYAVNGRWRHAFEYLGRALNDGDNQVRAALFTAVLNAMHASDNAAGAFSTLAEGLSAAFPHSDLHLYTWQESRLNCFFPDGYEITEDTRLQNPHGPEMQALHGADYTVVPVADDMRLLIPLRTELKPGTPVGLVSLGKLVAPQSPYRRRDEVMQLVSFLQQAARVVEERTHYASLLFAAETRVTKLNRLNTMLTQMLHHREWPESRILQLALTGITSPYGLDFNRAALFLLNENEQCLTVPFAVGQLTQQNAEAERQMWLQHPPETLFVETAVTHPAASPLRNALKRLRLPLYAPAPDLVLHQHKLGEALFSSSQLPRNGLPPELIQAIGAPVEFALVPLASGEHTFGVLYVDNKFSSEPITHEQFELLQTFVNQVALVLENARALVVERQRTSNWRQLLDIEKTLNNRVTQSVAELLETVVLSAQELFQADSVVVYPLQPDPSNSSYRYETKDVTAVGTQTAVCPSDKPRPTQGLAATILQQGQVAVSDVETAVTPKLRLGIETSTFLPREGIRAFIGIRLGSAAAPVGLLYLNWRHPHQLTAEQKTVLEVFANFVAIALPGARTYQQVQYNLDRRLMEMKGLDQLFASGAYFRSDEGIENGIYLALRRAQEYTNAPRIFLIRDEPKGAWGIYQLLGSGKIHSRQIDTLPGGLIAQAYTQGTTQLVTNAGRPETGRFRTRFFPESRSALAVPVKVTSSTLAVLYLESPEREGLKEHRRFLEKLASRLAVNLEQADRSRAMRELRSLSQRLADEANLTRLLAAIITQALNALQAVDAIVLYHQDPETMRYIATTVSSSQPQATAVPLSGKPNQIVLSAWDLPKGKFFSNIEKTPQLRQAFPHTNRYQATAVLPLEVGHNRVGCMFFGYKFQNPFSEGDRGTLELFAQLAALAILRARLHTEAEQRQQRLDTVSHITPIISASVEIDLIFRNLMQEILAAFPKVNNACIVEHLPDKNEVAVTGNTQQFYRIDVPLLEDETFRTRLDKRRGIAGRVLATGEPSLVADVSGDIDYIPAVATTQSQIGIPIMIDDVVSYVLVVESDELAAFTVEDQELLVTLAKHTALAVKNARQFQHARALELTRQTAMMATGLVHDINNAVAAFPDLVDEITYKYQNNRDIAAPLANLQKSARVTDKISGRLKDFVFTGEYRPELHDIATLVNNAIDLSKPQKPPHVTITREIAPDLPKVQADSLWIELLLKNLLVNAFTAVPTDRDGLVTVTAVSDDNHIHLTVQDNGKGIAKDLQTNVFKFGTSTKSDALHKMHGVGLFHCQLIAQVHNGSLQLESEPGIGTTFTLSLPLHTSKEPTAQEGLVDA